MSAVAFPPLSLRSLFERETPTYARIRARTPIFLPFSSPLPDSSVREGSRVGLVSVYLFERSKNYRTRAAGRRCLTFDRRATTRNLGAPVLLDVALRFEAGFGNLCTTRQTFASLPPYSKTDKINLLYLQRGGKSSLERGKRVQQKAWNCLCTEFL